MNCTEFCSLQSEYIDGTLDSKVAEAARLHLEECASCRRMYAEMSALVRTLHSMDDIAVPESLADRIIADLPTPKKKVIAFPRILRSWQTYSVAAACILVAVTLYSGAFDRYTVTNEGQVPYTVSGPEAESTSAPVPSEPAETIIPKAAVPSAAPRMAESTVNMSAEAIVPPAEPIAVPFSMARGLPIPEGASDATSDSAAASMPAAMDVFTPYQPVTSLWKIHMVFTTDDPAAEAIFHTYETDGAFAVQAALDAAGIAYTVQEQVEADYTAEYNALAEEAAALSARIDSGEEGLDDLLAPLKKEMQILQDHCQIPGVSLVIQN